MDILIFSTIANIPIKILEYSNLEFLMFLISFEYVLVYFTDKENTLNIKIILIYIYYTFILSYFGVKFLGKKEIVVGKVIVAKAIGIFSLYIEQSVLLFFFDFGICHRV